MSARHTAIARALTLRPPVDLQAWATWVRTTDDLTGAERDHVLAATPDDLRTVAAALEAQAVAELDQAQASSDAAGRFLDALAPWATDPTRDGWTLDRILADVRRLDPEAHAQLVTLHHAAYPTGLAEVPR